MKMLGLSAPKENNKSKDLNKYNNNSNNMDSNIIKCREKSGQIHVDLGAVADIVLNRGILAPWTLKVV